MPATLLRARRALPACYLNGAREEVGDLCPPGSIPLFGIADPEEFVASR
jgi:hypothetical protein